MKFALKGFFSIMLLIAAAGWVTQSNASGTCSTTNTGCGSDCDDCTDLCQPCTNNQALCTGGNVYGKTFYAYRSQGDNSARKMMGVEDKIHRFGSEGFYGVGTLAVEYQSLFRNRSAIGKWFSTNGEADMTYGIIGTPAAAPVANATFDINSLQFGVTSSGTISFCPKSSDIIIDLNLYFGLDELFCGLWGRLDIPVAHSSRQLNIVEVNDSTASSVYPTGVYGTGFVAVPSALLNTAPMTTALKGGDDSVFGSGLGAVPALNYGKVGCKRTTTNVAGIRLDLGYDFFRRERWHFAASLDVVVPVGSTPSAEYLFDAMVGDSKRAQVGATFNFAYELWSNCDATHNVAFYVDATITNMLKKRVQRLIGLNNNTTLDTANRNVWSQYLVLKKFNAAGDLVGLERAANLLATDIKVGADVDVDIALMFQWDCKCFFAGLGYEFWMRSAEKISQSCLVIPADTYAVKGVQVATAATSTLVDPTATINTVGTGVAFSTSNALPADAKNEIYDYTRALHPKAQSNKVFGFFGYNWTDCDWQPFVLVGGEVEFGNDNKAASQWGILGKGGISF